MINFFKIRSVSFCFVWFLIVCIFSGCSADQNASTQSNDNRLTFQMKWLSQDSYYQYGENDHSDKENICNDFGINDITISVLNSSNELITQKAFNCNEHKGSIGGIPLGHGYNLHAEAFVSGKAKAEWVSDVSNIEIHEGSSHVEVDMVYDGKDTQPPEVKRTTPKDKSKNVGISTDIHLFFSEKLAHSSVHGSSVLLLEGNDSVPGEVLHDPLTSEVVFSPFENLKYNTRYNIQITKDIKDCANLHMAQMYTIAFTTVAKSPDPSPIVPPKNFKGTSGDGKIFLSWSPVTQAESYIIYMGDSPGVVKDPSKFQTVDVKGTSYEWPQLVNGKAYYFIITSRKGSDESDASKEISKKPVMVPFEKDLALYYDFLDGNATDMSGNGNDGVVHHAVPVKDKLGIKDSALSFNGKNAYVKVSPFAHFTPLHFTVAVVLKVPEAESQQYILQKGAANLSFSLFMTGSTAKFPGCPFYSQAEPQGFYAKTFQYRLMDNSPFPSNEFVHLALTLKRVNQNYNKVYVLKSYINGVLQKTYNKLPDMFHANSPLFIGRSGSSKSTFYFKGIIDDLLIYRRVLSPQEIQTLFEFSEVKKQLVLTDENGKKEKERFTGDEDRYLLPLF